MRKRILAMGLSLLMFFSGVPVNDIVVHAGQTGGENGVGQGSLALQESDFGVKGSDSVGGMLAERISEQLTEQDANSGCNIFSLSMSGKTASVEFETTKTCTLLVAVYDEDGVQLLGSGSKTVKKEETTAEVTVEISSMPQYFYVEAYLINSFDYTPLCKAFSSPEYTQDMQKLLASTVDDYDSALVLNLDGDKTNNFLVYDKGVIQMEEQTEKNSITQTGEYEYEVRNADSTITGLKAGDIFAYRYATGEVLIVKVKTVSVEGTTVRIVSEDTDMNEVFDYVKIDSEGGMDQTTVDASACDEGITLTGGVSQEQFAQDETDTQKSGAEESDYASLSEEDVSGPETSEADTYLAQSKEIQSYSEETLAQSAEMQSYSEETLSQKEESAAEGYPSLSEGEGSTGKSVSFSVDKRYGDLKNYTLLSGSIDFSTVTKVKLDITKQHQYMEVSINYNAVMRLTATGHVQATLKLGQFTVVPVVGVFITFTPSLIAEASAKIEMDNVLSGSVGIRVDGKSGVTNISKSPQLKVDLKGEMTLFVGFSMEPKVAIVCDQLTQAKLIAKVGVEAKASMNTDSTNKAGDKHLCGDACVKGELYGKVSLSASAMFFNNVHLTFNYSLLDAKVKIDDFYYSIKYNDFGWGTCPHYEDVFENVPAVADTDLQYSVSYEYLDKSYSKKRYYIVINKYQGSSSSVKIPSKLSGTYWSTETKESITENLPVEIIYPQAFKNNTSVEMVSLPENVRLVCEEAFYGCTSLKRIQLPSSLESIESKAFYNCSAMKNIELPAGLTTLASSVFANCSSLESLEIPEGVTTLYSDETQGSFRGCSSLKSVTVGEALTRIDNYTFEHCEALEEFNFPASISYIGNGAFQFTSLKKANLPQRLSYLGVEAFRGCSKLEELTIGSNITEIGRETFGSCSSLKKLVLPNSIKTIRKWAFNFCTSLTELTIPNSVMTIEASAFSGCDSVTKLLVPASLISVGSGWFSSDALTDVYYGGSKEQWEALAGKYWRANIHYGATGIERLANETASMEEMVTDNGDWEIAAEKTAADKEGETSGSMRHEDFTGLNPNTLYNFYSVKNKLAEVPLAASNLLYIRQYRTDADGSLSVDYIPREEYENAESFVTAMPLACEHDYQAVVTKAPTCGVAGIRTYTCSKCGDSYTESIPATGAHVTSVQNKKAATYFETGSTGDTVCTVCGQVVNKGSAIAKLTLKAPTVKYQLKGKKLTVTYKKVKDATGFQIKYTLKGKAKTVNVKTKKNASKVIKNLKKGTYKVQVRAFVKKGSRIAYGKSKAKKVKVK